MGPISESIVIDAPRERIFGLLSDFGLRPAITGAFQTSFRLERLDPKGLGAAARYRVEAPFNHTWAETRIDRCEAPHLIREHGSQGRWGRIPNRTVWEVLGGPGSGAKVNVAFWTEPAHPLDKMRERLGSAGWYRRRLRQALERLRDLAESGETSPKPVATAAG